MRRVAALRENELIRAGLTAAPSSVVKPPRIAESPVNLECVEWGTLHIGGNRVVIGLIKRLHLRDELFDAEKKRMRADKLFLDWPHGFAALVLQDARTV